MAFDFSQDDATMEIHFDVFDQNGNILTPNSPQFSVSDDSLLQIISHTDNNVVLGHSTRAVQGIAYVIYSIVGRDGNRINRSEEINTIFGGPATITTTRIS